MTATASAAADAPAAPPPAPRVVALVPLVPAFAIAAVWLWWDTDGGGYFPTAWYPAGVLAACLLLTLAIARPGDALARSPALLPLGLLAAWTAWNGLSLLWADAPGRGWEETDALLAVTLMGAVMASTPWRPRSVLALLGLLSAAVAAIAAVDLVSFATDSRPEGWLLESRYLGPIGYANGTAALGAMAFWPLLALSTRPQTPAAVRVAALPAAVLVLDWALLPQSRGMMLAGGAALLLFVALAPHRVRVLTRLAVVAGAVAIAGPALFDVYTASREARPVAGIVDTAASRVVVGVVLALAASVVLVALEQQIRPSAHARLALRRVSIAALAVALVAGAVTVAAAHERITSSISDRWDTFNSDANAENTQTGVRLGQSAPDKRSDYWDVALDAFAERPVAGIGAGGYESYYTAHKRYDKHSRYAHSLWMRALSETGAVGLALLLAALAAMLAALVRLRRRGPVELHAAIAAVAALSAGFFLQSSFDWLDEVPALLAPAFCLPLAVLRAGRPPATGRRRSHARFAVVLAVVALVAMAPPYLAVRQLERGDDLRASDPGAAIAAYDRAASANPLAVEPHIRSGFLALRLRDAALARRSFEAALDVREEWVARFELGLLDAQAGRLGRARQQIRRAAQLNTNDPLVTDALARVEAGERLDPLEVNAEALEQPVLAGSQ